MPYRIVLFVLTEKKPIMVTDNNGRTHEPAGTPHGGRFARRNGFGSDSDLDDFTRTRTYADLDHYWNDEDYMLEA